MVSGQTKNWESALASLLGELSSVQQELLDVLVQKREHMAENNLEGISGLHDRESQVCERLQSCHDQRSTLLQEAKDSGLPSDSLQNLASAVTPGEGGELSRQIGDASSKMRLIQHQSLTNWVLAQRSLLHVSQMLEIVATGGRLEPTYGSQDPSNARGALVDREV